MKINKHSTGDITMFLDNKYTKYYYGIIQNSKNREELKNTYTERHHIIPKSLGGSNDLYNIAVLTAKEHFVCHLLLVKMTEGKYKSSMSYAAWQMTNHNNRKRHSPTSKQYAIMREWMSEAYTGRTLSEETKRKIGEKSKGRQAMLGKRHSKETRKKISESNTGISRPKSEETKRKMSETWLAISPDHSGNKNPMYGKKHSNETKALQSQLKQGENNPMFGKTREKFTCPHCLKTVGGKGNFKRWHGDNCKIK